MTRTISTAIVLAGALAVSLAGCATPGEARDGPRIVAATDVYGSIARAIAGDDAHVESIVDSANQDPHSYEATARDLLTVTRADLVIRNGGGYDPFMDQLVDESGASAVITAVEVSGLGAPAEGDGHPAQPEDHEHGDNEHVWYHVGAMMRLVEQIEEALSELDPARASGYRANAERYLDDLAALEARVRAISLDIAGRAAVSTEPVADYLLEELGLDNRTPAAFARAVEAEMEVPPAAVKALLDELASGEVALFVWNIQTTGPAIEQAVEAARGHGIPILEVTETLDGRDYREWMAAILDDVEVAMRHE